IIPKGHGGTDAASNLQILCWPCHKAKTARARIS
ncbi:HNH endonuclease, partial [Escherichia coli]